MTYLQRVGCSFRYYLLGLGFNFGADFVDHLRKCYSSFLCRKKELVVLRYTRRSQASATIYSLIESAKANALEPYKYLRYLFEKLPFAKTADDYKKLLQANLDQQQLENAQKVSLV